MATINDTVSLSPAEMANKAVNAGIKKANLKTGLMFALAVLAGAFIAFGAVFATTIATGGSALPFGVKKLLIGLVFTLGLILVVIGGAELFTGNNLIVMAYLNKKISLKSMLRNWGIVYVGNFVGSVAVALLILLSKQYTFNNGGIGLTALNIGAGKLTLGFGQCIALGILCNILVCMAVWMTFSGKTAADKILAMIPPIAAFVAAGFEHSVANMFFVPMAILIKDFGGSNFFEAIGKTPADFSTLTWGNFLVSNLLPVTIGNIIGGGLIVGVMYWFIYLRNGEK